MDKWADYVIVGVQYDTDHSRIARVRRSPDLGDKLGEATIVSRASVVDSIRGESSYITAYRDPSDNAWRKGDDVCIVTVDGTDFIRIDGNETKADNLGELPEFQWGTTSLDVEAILAKDPYVWARDFREHPRWGPLAQSINNVADLIRECPNNMPATGSDHIIRQLDDSVDNTYLGIVATASQTILDGKQVNPLADEIRREMGPDVLSAMQAGGLPADTRAEIRNRLWRKLAAMPPIPPWWKFW